MLPSHHHVEDVPIDPGHLAEQGGANGDRCNLANLTASLVKPKAYPNPLVAATVTSPELRHMFRCGADSIVDFGRWRHLL